MKRTKLLLLTIVAMLLTVVMAFAVTACGKKDKSDQDDNNPSADLGITDKSEDKLALQYITVTGAATNFTLGQQFTAGSIIVRAYYYDLESEAEVTVDNPDARQVMVTLSAEEYTIDSSEYVADRVGVYTIYVSHTHAGVTRTASYEVTVNGREPAIGGIWAEINTEVEGGVTDYRLSESLKEVEIKGDRILVYSVITDANGDAARGDLISDADYTVRLYRGATLIEDFIAKENGSYTLEVERKSDGSKDFAVYRVANAVESIEFVSEAEGTLLEQARSNKDRITDTWNFKATYANGVTKELNAKSAGMKIAFNSIAAGAQSVKVTYTEVDALREEHSVQTTVSVNILPNTETLVIDYEYIAPASGEHAKGASLIEGDGVLTAYNGSLAGGSTKKTYTDGKELETRVQANKSKGVMLQLEGSSLVTVYYVSGTTAQQCWLALYNYGTGSEVLMDIVGKNTGNAPLEPVALALSKGTYILHTHADSPATSANIQAIYIKTLIPPTPAEGEEEKDIAIFTATFNENYGDGAIKAQYAMDYEGYNTVKGYEPTRSGYTFDGWYTAAEGGEKVSMPATLTQNVTFYAHWTENEVEEIAATKVNTTYVLTNESIVLDSFNDITVRNAAGGALSNSWNYSYKLYSDSECTAEVANGVVEAVGTYYIKVTAVKGENEKTLTATVAIEVVNPSDMTAKAGKSTFTVQTGKTATVTAEDINLTLTAAGGEVLGDLWALSYALADEEGGKVEGTDSWTVDKAGEYTLTVTATKGDVVLTATVTLTVIQSSGGVTVPDAITVNADGLEASSDAYASECAWGDSGIISVLSGVKVNASKKTVDGEEITNRMQTTGAVSTTQKAVKIDLSGAEYSGFTAKVRVVFYVGSADKRVLKVLDSTGAQYWAEEEPAENRATGTQLSVTAELECGSVYYLGGSNGINIYKIEISFEGEETGGGSETDTPDTITVNADGLEASSDAYASERAWGDSGIISVLSGVKVNASKKTVDGEEITNRMQTTGAVSTTQKAVKIDLSGAEYSGFTAKVRVVFYVGSADKRVLKVLDSTGAQYWAEEEPAENRATGTQLSVTAELECGSIYYLGGSNGINIYKIEISFE